MANEILIRMVACGKQEMEHGHFELALDHFSELLELLYFNFFPGVLLMKAECLLKLVRKKRGFVFPVSSQNIITKELLLHRENGPVTVEFCLIGHCRIIGINTG